MPISRDEYEQGEFDTTVYLLQLLRSYADIAFSAAELAQITAKEGRNMDVVEVADKLSFLVTHERIECKEVRGILYYIYQKRPLGFRPSGG